MTVHDILLFLNQEKITYIFRGSEDIIIEGASPLKDIKNKTITWVRNLQKSQIDIINQKDNILVVCNDSDLTSQIKHSLLLVDNPHRIFFKIIEALFYTRPYYHSTNSVIRTENYGEGLNVGDFTYIGENVVLGRNCSIAQNVVIDGCVTIGDNCIIEPGVKIGVTGFGRYRNDNNTCNMVPHIGGVRIGNSVYIGANTIIARGTLSDTVIGDHTKIDSLCGIAHNATIGNRVIITGMAAVAGSATVEDDCWLSPGVIINSAVTVGQGSFVGMNSIVTHDMPGGQYIFGNPAKVIKENTDTKYNI